MKSQKSDIFSRNLSHQTHWVTFNAEENTLDIKVITEYQQKSAA